MNVPSTEMKCTYPLPLPFERLARYQTLFGKLARAPLGGLRERRKSSPLLRRLQGYSCVVLFERVTPLSSKHAKKQVILVA